MTGNTSISEAHCHIDDSDTGKDVYILNLVWYLQVEGAFPSSENDKEHNSFNNTPKKSDSNHNADGKKYTTDIHLEHQDTAVRDEHSQYSFVPENKTLCGVFTDKDPIRSANNDKSQSDGATFVNNEQRISHSSTSASTAKPKTLNPLPSTQTKNKNGFTGEEEMWNVVTTNRDKRLIVSMKQLIDVMKQHIGLTLKDLDVTDFVFQVYHLKANDEALHDGERAENIFISEEIVMSSVEYPQSTIGIGFVLYLRLNSSENRYTFESNILHHFVGTKNFTIDNDVITVEQVLSSSEKASVNASRPVYLNNPLSGDCCIYVDPDKQPEQFRKIFCFRDVDRAIPFNAVTPCPYIAFDVSDFNVSGNFELIRKDMKIRRSQYILQNRTVLVCLKTLEHSLQHIALDVLMKVPLLVRIESLLTLTALSLSLICLVLTFITYLLFPMLRSLPGKNNMIMVGWLFVAQLLVMLNPLPPKHSTACTIMGVLLHYSWLSTVTWTCVCSFHMYHVFVVRRGAPSPHKSHAFYLIRYILVSNISTDVVVISVVFTNMYLYGADTIGYGGRICYLNTTVLVGVAFLLPLSLVLLFNVIFFFLTIYTISRIEDVKRHSGRERVNVHIYFRLSSLTGLCWFLALLAEIPGLRPLRCVSVLVNGCQGLTLFLSYVCNRRVARMWCHLLKTKSTGLKRRSVESSRQATFSSSM